MSLANSVDAYSNVKGTHVHQEASSLKVGSMASPQPLLLDMPLKPKGCGDLWRCWLTSMLTTSNVQLLLCGQSPEVIMAVALAAIKFAEQQSSLVSQLREEELVQVGCCCTQVCT